MLGSGVKKWIWFVGIWLASVGVLSLVALMIKSVLT